MDANHEVQVLRLDESLAERTTFGPPVEPRASGIELAVFAQDRWRVNDRLNFELGFRIDRDGVIDRLNYSPRVGLSLSVLPEGRGILRGGIGKFAERTPLAVNAFTQYGARTVQRFAVDQTPLGSPVTFVHTMPDPLRTPESIVQTVAWDQRWAGACSSRRLFCAATACAPTSSIPTPAWALLTLSSSGASRYWEVETTGRWLASEHRDFSVSYVRTQQHAGSQRLRPVLRQLPESDHPPQRELAQSHRRAPPGRSCAARSACAAQWVFSPIYEWRSGFPWSAVDEFQDFVGTRNRAGRLPSVSTLDFTIARPMRFRKYRFTAGIKVYNTFDHGSERDVQTNLTSPDYGQFYNPIQRSIGFLISTSRP